ncbi:uncharacterized protein LOC128680386 isoform X2 [Plodia interpunctella]|uniref:uncharacterized protein LOC128680386 isoform X2 n=1 Tax=Plodia interpunctella TaxID=58824 RepID=UPI002367C09C|nr:uncharacterized protein LOC128680386 isoform X2 [Plodia interpunctella]
MVSLNPVENLLPLAALGLVLLGIYFLYKWKRCVITQVKGTADCPPCTPVTLVHRLCPHHNVVQSFEVEQKDSLDEHLDVLTRKLAEKEGRLRLSKSKIRETQHEIDNLHAIDHDVKVKYKEIMESLRTDLLTNEKDCKKLQEQIEWVSRRRAELREEIVQSDVASRKALQPLHRRLIQELDSMGG